MEQIEASAQISVARGSGFGLLAIFCVMIGLSGTPVVALETGGVLNLLACFILIAKAEFAPGKPYKQTEVWLMLDDRSRPPAAVAQQIISTALRSVYRQFALYFAKGAAVCLGVSVFLSLLG